MSPDKSRIGRRNLEVDWILGAPRGHTAWTIRGSVQLPPQPHLQLEHLPMHAAKLGVRQPIGHQVHLLAGCASMKHFQIALATCPSIV